MPKRARHVSEPSPGKQRVYATKFNPTWCYEFPWIKGSSVDANHAFCTLCSAHINVSHGGKHDVRKHENSDKHKWLIKNNANNAKVSDMFRPGYNTHDNVTKAEVLFCGFVAEHNLPFLISDHFTNIVSKMFPDSKIAKEFACKRTKTTNVIKNALASSCDKYVTELCRSQKFSILTDESNDQGNDKCLIILVRVYDPGDTAISTKFLAMPHCNFSSAADLFKCIDDIFRTRDIPWTNCVGYMSDNANVMIGAKNSVLSRIKEQNPKIFNLGCVCHLANLCAQADVKSLPVRVEEFLIDVYFHFHHSNVNNGGFVLKHSTASLHEQCVNACT